MYANGMTHDEWKRRYGRMAEIARRIDAGRLRRKRRLCKAAGLDPNLLGIHPHNAMVGFRAGRPWPGVDYSKVRAIYRVDRLTRPWDVITRWDRRMRGLEPGGAV